jgi:hypothetical protein
MAKQEAAEQEVEQPVVVEAGEFDALKEAAQYAKTHGGGTVQVPADVLLDLIARA